MDTKVVLITGGSRGIGAATARLASQRGYDVCFSYYSNEDAANAVVTAVQEQGQKCLAIKADVASEDDVLRVWSKAIETFERVDALVNNAGVLDTQMRLDEVDAPRVERILRVNVLGAILCAREAVRHMSTRHGGTGGSIVNISSLAAKYGSPLEYVDYAASKAAVDTMTVGLAKEVAGEGVRVNSVRPGAICTEIHASGGEPNRVDRLRERIPMKRGGEPDEIAEAILWLISDQASYTTGAILEVGGGL